MTTLQRPERTTTIAAALELLFEHGLPFRLTAYDGSAAGPPDATVRLHLANERGLSYLLTAPGDLGMARAYVQGDLSWRACHPGDPYDALRLFMSRLTFRRPSPAEARAAGPCAPARPPGAAAAAAAGGAAALAARRSRALATAPSATPRRSTTTTTCRTGSTSWCSGRR